jgi:hypothetical protein
MKIDITRSTFDPRKHFAAVHLQQGRVPMDADYNEQADITAHLHETSIADLAGYCAVPLHADGFRIVASSADLTPEELARPGNAEPPARPALAGGWDFYLTAGRCYAGGVLCENERIVPYSAQPDFPDATLPQDGGAPREGAYLAYLDVWRRAVTALEDPSIREVALGGPDTAARSRTVWQLRLFRLGPASLPTLEANCLTESPGWNEAIAPGSGRVAARAEPGAADEGPCIVAPGAGYRRLENQLYRVEVHEGGTLGTATFKWSRENASILAAWEGQQGASDEILILASAGRDAVHGFASGQWIELTDDTRELRGESGTLVRIITVEGVNLTIDPATATGPIVLSEFPRRPKVRRWDHEALLQPADGTTFHNLEGGVQVRFESGTFRAGDYWLIPARTATGDIEWERDSAGDPLALLPHGIVHHHCRIAIMRFDGAAWSDITDCRPLFPSATDLVALHYVGGDGQEALPGETLAHPLQVRVTNGAVPVAGRRVRFSVIEGGGHFSDPQPVLTTGPDGFAQASWTLGSTVPGTQRVEAALLDASDEPVPGQRVAFNANQSIASEVAYDPGDCKQLDGATTVQLAIDRLAGFHTLSIAGGDGQSGDPGRPLPRPLRALVSSRCGPRSGVPVRFSVLTGVGSVPDDPVVSGPDGIAEAQWTLGSSTETQEVMAAIVLATEAGETPAGQPTADPRRVFFHAQLRTATAQDPGVRIEKISIRTAGNRLAPLRLGEEKSPDELRDGIRIDCDRPIDSETVKHHPIHRGEPTCSVTVEVPFPLTEPDRALWGAKMLVGYSPLVLAGDVTAEGRAIIWTPADAAINGLNRVLRAIAPEEGTFGRRVLARLRLAGSFIWSLRDQTGNRRFFMDGETFRAEKDPGIELPSGDGRRGGDFEMWFWFAIAPGFTLQPPALPAGTVVGTILLPAATPDTLTVRLESSNPQVAKLPDSIDIPAGQTEGKFSIEVASGPTREIVTIRAFLSGAALSQTLTRTASPGLTGGDAPRDDVRGPGPQGKGGAGRSRGKRSP